MENSQTEWPIKDLARAAGLTSRALRHYEQIGLLIPSRIGSSGYRFYGDAEVARLYRILSLRALELPLSTIKTALDDNTSLGDAIEAHLALLEEQRDRLDDQITAVRDTLASVRKGHTMSIEELFAAFDPAAHESEVRTRWGDDAWERSAQRRAAMTDKERATDDRQSLDLNAALRAAAEAGEAPGGARFQAMIAGHHAWVTTQWGGKAPSHEAYTGLSELYVADSRFAAVFGGTGTAEIVRDAMRIWADAHLR